MVRKSCFILGIGLAVLWWVGLSQNHAATILWFDAVAAVLAFGIAALLPDPEETTPSRALGPAVLGLGLAAVWIVGMAAHQPVWASWLNFAFALSFIGVATSAALSTGWAHQHRALSR
jgi:NO-binding membrane sensor protein with MHYT domain